MSHIVLCKYRNDNFDRDTVPFVQVAARRYAHATCAKERGVNLPIIDPNNIVICKYCNKTLDIREAVKITTGCFAHPECVEHLTDSEILDQYIMKIFEVDYVPPNIKKQINQYVKDYRFTYSGILKSLKYFFEVKKQPINKNSQTIGIVPYVYQQAYNYYYTIWLANQKNQDTIIEKPKVVEIQIQRPDRKKRHSNKFNFLEEEE